MPGGGLLHLRSLLPEPGGPPGHPRIIWGRSTASLTRTAWWPSARRALLTNHEYLDFEAFWEDRSSFSLEDLFPNARPVFQRLSTFARQFQPWWAAAASLAWDISETLGHLRTACACELISMDEYREMSQYWVEQAAAFHSWEEYAVAWCAEPPTGPSAWGEHGEQDAAAYLDLNLRLVRQLLDSKQAWAGRMWYRIPRKPFLFSALGAAGAPARLGRAPTDAWPLTHITVLGKQVGWCYRERPDGQYPDSGWRFFSGEEDEAYINDIGHTGVYDLKHHLQL